MAPKIKIALVVVATAGVALYLFLPTYLIKTDLQRLCDISQEMLPKIEADPAAGISEYSQQINSKLITSEVKNVLSAIKVSEDSQKTPLLQKGLEELGHPGWQCAAFNKIYIGK